MLTVSQVMAQLGISRSTVRRWIRAGYLTAYTTPTGQYRFNRQDVENLLSAAWQREVARLPASVRQALPQ